MWLYDADGLIHDVVVTDSAGVFQMKATDSGPYHLEVRHLQYLTEETEIQHTAGLAVGVRVNMTPRATILDPLVVTAAPPETGPQLEFKSREGNRRGHRATYEELQRSAAGTLSTYIRFWASFYDRGCKSYFIDGRPVRSDRACDLPLDWIYGLEIYRMSFDAPLRYRRGPGCGVVLLWTTTPGQD